MLIADEVQGGIARTGKMFSIEHSGVVPDLITVAKGLGGGFPLSGVIGRARSWTRRIPAASAAPTAATRSASRRRTRCSTSSRRRICRQRGESARAQELLRRSRRAKACERHRRRARPRRDGGVRARQGSGDRGAGAALDQPRPRPGREARADPAFLRHRGNVVRLLPPLTIQDAVLEEALLFFERRSKPRWPPTASRRPDVRLAARGFPCRRRACWRAEGDLNPKSSIAGSVRGPERPTRGREHDGMGRDGNRRPAQTPIGAVTI